LGVIPAHVSWLHDTGERQSTACGCEIEIWALTPEEDEEVLSAWARHFRQHYISDEDLPAMVDGTGLSTAEYLRATLFPDASRTPGPSLRSGDFGEILVADYIEYLLGYWSPRILRYQDRWNRNDSTKGCDVIGFRFATDAPHHPDDELFIFESKSGMAKTGGNRLQDAIVDSMKDHLREAMTLNAMKQRMRVRGHQDQADKVKRYQNEAARPFKRINGAAAILDDEVFAATDFTIADATAHPNASNLRLIVIRGPSLMTLIHALYERAANEA
jgi:Cap4 SAVED domain